MKQILTYISPDHEFNEEHKMAVKIQIDNSLRLGWRREDILLVTNFPYEYNGVKACVIRDDNYCPFHWPATKIYVICKLFRMGMIKKDVFWYHDFDCFQLNKFDEDVLGDADMGVTNYGRMPRLCSASIFFKESSRDIFIRLKDLIDESKQGEESRMTNLAEIEPRIKKLNITYAFHKFNLVHCYARADKPIKAAHFHLTPDKYDFYVKGNNNLNKVLIPQGLIDIFNKHGWTEQ